MQILRIFKKLMTYKGSIWLVNFEPVIGSEQGKIRPAVIISEEEINKVLPVLNVIPITSQKEGRKVYANETLIESGKFGLMNNSIILSYQIRTIDKKRLVKELGFIDDQTIREKITKALCFQLGIKLN